MGIFKIGIALALTVLGILARPAKANELPPLPKDAELALDERWSEGTIDADRWYVLRKKWGQGNNGVVPENVRIDRDVVSGRDMNVLVCTAHGDQYDGPVIGLAAAKMRVGGVIVSKGFFASGRIEVVMKIGTATPTSGGPKDPTRPIGSVPAIWTYAYLYVDAMQHPKESFVADLPLYNPHMSVYGVAANEYWSELDFPECGKDGIFEKTMYNTFLQNRHDSRLFDVRSTVDGQYHTYVTEWRTQLTPMSDLRDDQAIEHSGYWWICDKSVNFNSYLGNPVKRLGQNDFALYCGEKAVHWIDGKKVGENTRYVPAMAAQLNLGVWLPQWAGPAPWKESTVSFASVKVWQYNDPGDVRGVLTEDIKDTFDKQGHEVK